MIQMNVLNRWQALPKFSKKEKIALLKQLDEASYAGDISLLRVLLEEDKLLLDRTLNEVRDSPLHIAAFHGHVDFISEILQLKPELAKRLNKEGQSPLHIAAERGHLQVVQKLVDQVGTDICHVLDEDGYLPIHTAAMNGKKDVVVLFIERCDQETLHKRTSTDETLLHLAVKVNSLETIRLLMSSGAKLDAKDNKGNTCLHIAVARRNYRVINDLLQDIGSEINTKNAKGQTPLDVLCESWQYFDDVSLVNMIRTAGGMRAVELTDFKSIRIHSSKQVTSSTSSGKKMMMANLRAVKKNCDAGTLLVVATLVATITFQVILNPPGGFVQGDSNNSDQNKSFPPGTPPPPPPPHPGTPVLLDYLGDFYLMNFVGLFASVSVILLLLCGALRNKILMKFLVWVVWFAVFCTALGFTSALDALMSWQDDYSYNWLLKAWLSVLVMGSLWVSTRVIALLLRYGALLKGRRPNWIVKLGRLKLNGLVRKIISIISIVVVLAILLLVNRQIIVPIIF